MTQLFSAPYSFEIINLLLNHYGDLNEGLQNVLDRRDGLTLTLTQLQVSEINWLSIKLASKIESNPFSH